MATPKKTKTVTAQKSSVPKKVKAPKLYLLIKDPNDDKSLVKLKTVLSSHPGTTQAVLVLGADKTSAVKLPFGIDIDNGLQEELLELVGNEGVAVK